jgi:fructose-1,6-bisphosphatase/inositol monophosphatase family enzyme
MGSEELDTLFRISARVQSRVREEITAPHRADVVAMGADGSPTEEIDRVAEGEILSALEQEGLPWDLLSEEIGLVRRGGERVLVVDPIDGSHNALRDIPLYSLSMALGRADLNGIELAVVRDFSHGTTFWARRGEGAFRDGRPIRTRRWDQRSELFMVNLGRHSTPRAVALAGKGRRIRSFGCASLELVTVAHGGADAYIFENDTERRNLRITDIAAGYLIVIEAGGGVSDVSGREIGTLALDLDRHTSVFAWGDPEFARQASGPGYLSSALS